MPRANGKRIGFAEAAVAASRPGAFVDHASQQPSRRRVRDRGTEHGPAVVYLGQAALVVPAHAVIERELAGDLPGILQIQPHGMFPELRVLFVPDGGVVDGAKQETSVRETHISATEGRRLQVGQAGLGAKDVEDARGAHLLDVGPDVLAPLRASLVGVISVDPGRARHRGRLIVVIKAGVGRPDGGCRAAARVGEQKTALPRAKARDLRKARRIAPQPEGGRVVGQHALGRRVVMLVMHVSQAHMHQESGRHRLIQGQANRSGSGPCIAGHWRSGTAARRRRSYSCSESNPPSRRRVWTWG